MRRRYIQLSSGDLVEITDDYQQDPVAPLVMPDIPEYLSPVTGMWVVGRNSRREDMKRAGSRPWEGMEQEQKEAARQKAYTEAKLQEKANEAAARAFAQLSPEKREILRHADGGLTERRARQLDEYARRK